ncbi:TPA: hypothetical protein DGH83_00030 [Candidatus Peregrinibacteria bacterium]|nr:hypothetical protein [Candidatus Peregrinibacteria bacterium]
MPLKYLSGTVFRSKACCHFWLAAWEEIRTEFVQNWPQNDGAVPCLGFYPDADGREVGLSDDDPDSPYEYLGGRDVLGTFLS